MIDPENPTRTEDISISETPTNQIDAAVEAGKSSEKLPSYSVEIYFGVHKNSEDVSGVDEGLNGESLKKFSRVGLAERIKEADIYVPELHGWDDISMNSFNDLSSGRVTPEELIREKQNRWTEATKKRLGKTNLLPQEIPLVTRHPMFGFMKAEMDMIYKSYKPIMVLDVPSDNQKADALNNHYNTDKEVIGPEKNLKMY